MKPSLLGASTPSSIFHSHFISATQVVSPTCATQEAYNYHTLRNDDPRNLVLLCTTQGMAVQQDGRGATRLFHHAVDEAGKIHRYWLEAEESEHKASGKDQ